MSFLPYAKPPAALWAASITGSSVLHFGLAALLLTSSVALLPAPVRNPPRAPNFEVTLDILDADIINPEPEGPLIPPDAVPLSPDNTVANLMLESPEAILTPQQDPEALLEPIDQISELLEQYAGVLKQPDAATDPDNLAGVGPLIAAPTDETALLPDATLPLPPSDAPNPNVMTIDDISPIDSAEISPLAIPVAPAAIAQPDVVTLAPDVVPEDEVVALLLPEETAPPTDTPEAVQPIATPPKEDPEAQVIVPADADPDQEAQVGEEPPETATADANAPQVVSNPDLTTAMIGTLIQRIRATPAPRCTLALPRRAGPDGVGVSFVGGQEASLGIFAVRLLEGLSPIPVQTREIIDPRQCALLDAVRQIADYPAGRIGIALDATTLRSGDNLRGRIVGAGGLFVTLLVIDDNGVVQDLSRFTTLEDNNPVFDAPVARSGPARATRQIILVLGSDTAPIDVSGQIGQEAEAVFSALPPEVLQTAVFGLATFDVR